MDKFFSKNGLWLNYIICINVYAFSRYVIQIINNYVFKYLQPGLEWVNFANTIFFILLFLCGCLAGYLINKRTILHASLATTIAAMFSTFVGTNLSNYKWLLTLLALSAVLGGLGGAAALLVRKFCQSRQNKHL